MGGSDSSLGPVRASRWGWGSAVSKGQSGAGPHLPHISGTHLPLALSALVLVVPLQALLGEEVREGLVQAVETCGEWTDAGEIVTWRETGGLKAGLDGDAPST